MMVVVPKNTWHQFEAPDGVCVMTATPQPTEHLRGDDLQCAVVSSGTYQT